MEDLTQPPPRPNKNWCCILSTSVLSGGMCFFGVSLVFRGDGRTGMVLLLSSAGLLALSVCAALGKCKDTEEEDKPQAPPEEAEDRPPSYRLSWRRSFMRRLRHSEDVENGINGTEGGGRGGDGTNANGGRRGWRGAGRKIQSGNGGRRENNPPAPASFPNPDSSSSLGSLLALETSGIGAAVGSDCPTWILRQTQSMSNLLDPPPYQVAVANMDEAAIRKLRSELCLPSSMQ